MPGAKENEYSIFKLSCRCQVIQLVVCVVELVAGDYSSKDYSGVGLRDCLLILILCSSSSQISRCLKPGGRFVSVTFAQPFFRKRLYARSEYHWSIKQYSYGEGFEYFVYVMTKGEQLSPEDAALERKQLEDTKSPASSIATTQNEDKEDFLSNIDLWHDWIVWNSFRNTHSSEAETSSASQRWQKPFS